MSTRTAVVCVMGVVSALALACAQGQSGIYYATGADAVTPDGLHRVNWEPFKLSYVKPGADLARYDQVMIDAITVSYGRGSLMDPDFPLTAEGMAQLKQMFHDEFARQLAKSASFRIATAPGPSVLSLQGHLVDLTLSTPPASEQPDDETIVSQGFGAVTLMLDARDSQSGEPLVRVGERREIQLNDDGFDQSNPVSKSAAWQELVEQWGSALRRELDQLHALPEIPIPAAQ